MKLGFAAQSSADAVIFADSDVLFLRDYDLNSLWRDDLLRIYCKSMGPNQKNCARYRKWHSVASKWLASDNTYNDYIAQLTCMRPHTAHSLLASLELANNRPWYECLLGCLDFSEYVLYGRWVEKLGEARSGHYLSEDKLCHSSWFYDIQTVADVPDFINEMSDHQSAIHLQSNLNLDAEATLSLMERCAIQLQNKNLGHQFAL